MTSDIEFQTAAAAYMSENYAVAFPLMKKCAERDNPKAQFLLALMYKEGEGTESDDAAYRYWLQRLVTLATQGNAEAQWELSCKYRWANHFPLDIDKANCWLGEAAKNGNADAQYHLAVYYEHGDYGYEQARDKARYWFLKAVEQGYAEALYVYSFEFFEDTDKKRPSPRAMELLRRAADQNFSPAKELLKQLLH